MKKIVILIAFVLFGLFTSAQTTLTVGPAVPTKTESYNRWAVGADFGNHMVADKTSTSVSQLGSFGVGVRYNVNPKFGIGLTGGTDIVDLTNDLTAQNTKLNYTRFNFETYVNVFNMVDIYSDKWTTLFHGGPGISFINSTETKTLPNLRGGFTVLYRVANRVSLKADMSVTGNYGEPMNINGSTISEPNTGVHSLIANASVGVSISFGKNKKHMDNFVPVKVEPSTITYTASITNIDTTIQNIHNHKTVMLIDNLQFVFFENDKYEVRDTELNAIFKTYRNLLDNPSYTLVVRGSASASPDVRLPVDSNNYNLKLSENRANTLKQKFVDMGVDANRISVEYYGKDTKFPKESVFDVARRVELVVVTDKK